MDMMEKLSLAGLVPVIKVEDAADAVPLCRALSKGGLPVAEITFRTDAAEEAIRRVHEELPEVMLGAGTVLTKEQVDRAVAAGAAYIVSPGLNREIVRYCREKGVLEEKDDPQLLDFAHAWVDFVREGKGFFWWGGVGKSTSHTSYHLIRSGAPLPLKREDLRVAS